AAHAGEAAAGARQHLHHAIKRAVERDALQGAHGHKAVPDIESCIASRPAARGGGQRLRGARNRAGGGYAGGVGGDGHGRRALVITRLGA
nr:hypothetical protein [Tanacetum cinerariifolium]